MPKLPVREYRGEVITEPGIYLNMPLTVYHSDCCDGPSISSSGLRAIELETPLHYWDKSYLNPHRDPEAIKKELEAEHFRIGRAAHYKTLEPEVFDATIAVRPGIWDSWRSKDSQKWAMDHQKAGYTILTPVELERVEGIARAIKTHPRHADGLLGGLVEASMIVKDTKTGVWLKSRPDSIPRDDMFSDLKCMDDASPRSVGGSIHRLGYDMQMALAGICFEKVTGVTVDSFWIVAVESKRPHAIHVATLSTDMVHWARIRLRHAIDVFAQCLETGIWPAYDADGQEVAADKKYDFLQNGGLLPKEAEF